MHRIDPAQISASNFSYLRFPLERWLDDMASLEVGKVELWGVSPHLYVEDATAADIDRVRREIEARGLELTCFTPEQVMYPINIAAREERIRERSVRYFEKCVDACVGLGAPLLFLTPGWGYVGEDDAEVWKRSADALSRIVSYADERGIRSVLEALQPVESHVITTSAQIRRMLDDVGHPALGAAVDIPAMAVAGETVADYTAAFGDRLWHAHFVDGAPGGHLAWGDGELPMERYLDEFAAGGFTGHLSFEIISDRYWLDPLPPVRQSIERIRAALAA
ncbi:TIM barrel protein [Patulibacter sp. SYSU D01012]|uniref:sugar phosphate isomerase/epimerase family protein n=1 Tax=Patulibacter sp. SYSU D01012 TaxID=2817381 RepID=UPI001B309319